MVSSLKKMLRGGAKVGYIGSGIFERRMKLDTRGHDARDKNNNKAPKYRRARDLKNLKYQYSQGAITANLINRIEAYVSVGTMQVKIEDRPMKGVQLKYTSDWDVVFGAGARGILIYWGESLLGVSALYMRTCPSIDSVRQNGRSRPPKGANIHYDEWQVGVSASRPFGWAVPYIGIGFGKATVKVRDFKKDPAFTFRPRNQTFENRTPAMLFFGVSLTPHRIVVANFEGEVIGEYGVSGSIDLRF